MFGTISLGVYVSTVWNREDGHNLVVALDSLEIPTVRIIRYHRAQIAKIADEKLRRLFVSF